MGPTTLYTHAFLLSSIYLLSTLSLISHPSFPSGELVGERPTRLQEKKSVVVGFGGTAQPKAVQFVNSELQIPL